MAGGADQRGRHSPVAGGRRGGSLPDGRHHQHDGAGRIHRCPRRRRGRRDHRCREHRPAPARAPQVRQRQVDRADHPRSVDRGALRHRPRDDDRRTGSDARVLHGRTVGRVLRAAGPGLPGRDAGLHGGGADGDASPVPAAAGSRAHRAPGVSAGALAQAPLRDSAFAGREDAPRDFRGRRPLRRRSHRRVAFPRGVAASRVQGKGLPDALGSARGNLAPGDLPHHTGSQPRAARHSRRAQLRRPYRSRSRRGRALRRELHRELDQRRSQGGLRHGARERRGRGRRLSRALPRRANLSEGADQGGADRGGRIHRRAHLRPRAAGPARKGARGGRRAEGHPRAHRPPSGTTGRGAAGAGQGEPGERGPLRGQARATCAGW